MQPELEPDVAILVPYGSDATLCEHVASLIERLPEHDVSLLEIVEIIGRDSLLLLVIFLSLIFLVPVSIPGVSTVFGVGIALVGLTRLLQIPPWLPQRLARRRLAAGRLRQGLVRSLVWLHRLENISRPHRLARLCADGWMVTLNNLALIFAALLLMLPFGLIPFSNTLPALAVISLALGMLQRDGAAVLLGYLGIVVTLAYFATLVSVGSGAVASLLSLL